MHIENALNFICMVRIGDKMAIFFLFYPENYGIKK